MQHVVVLGGGVGGTLAANLIARKLKKQIAAGEARVTVVDETGNHAYQPGYMYIAMGQERAEKLVRPERKLLDGNVDLVVDTIERIDPAAQTVQLASGSRARLRRSWSSRPAPGSCPRRSSTSTPRPTTSTPRRPPRSSARRSTRSPAGGS